ncbi:hypothetical protein [Streptomyces sp. NPDC017890]
MFALLLLLRVRHPGVAVLALRAVAGVVAAGYATEPRARVTARDGGR